jgi:hypothetical protein
MLLALLYGVKQHCLLSCYFFDYKKVDQVTLGLRGRCEIDPDEDLEVLIPTARAIRTILEAHSTCDCVLNTDLEMVAAMEAVRALARGRRRTVGSQECRGTSGRMALQFRLALSAVPI